MQTYYVYILANDARGTLFIGMTSNLLDRVLQHKHTPTRQGAARYVARNLVYYEEGRDVRALVRRQKQLRTWDDAWKIRLIERSNPTWRDLYPEVQGGDIIY